MLIVITGKGGVGKTMISTLLIKAIAELKVSGMIDGKILSVDADPASNFASALGITAKGSVGDIREDMRRMIDKGAFPQIDKEIYFDGKIFEITSECDIKVKSKNVHYDFIEMGRPEGFECYCALNDMLRKILKRMESAYEFIVVDCEAGLEHISRKTTTKADIMLVITDTSNAGFKTAMKISKLAESFGVKKEKMFLVINKFTDDKNDMIKEKVKNSEILPICIIPYDKEIIALDTERKPLIEISDNSKAYKAILELTHKILLP